MALAEIPLCIWRKRSRTFDFRGQTIRYWTAGQGEPLLLIHGFPSASWDWHYLWQPLAQRYRVIACDMLGFGDSAKPVNHEYSLLEQADLQQALLAQLGVEQPVHLLAHDYGDSVAQELLARHYDSQIQIASCVFLNGGLFPKPIARADAKTTAQPIGLDDWPRVQPRCIGEEFSSDLWPSDASHRERTG
jgi:pimeloyl-ACP methyl ester carboxylesterase